MDHSYLNDILILFTAAVIVVVMCLRLRLPPILGYLGVGVLMGPYGLQIIADTEHTRNLAEFGVVFLLFTIGLEFSLAQLMRMRGTVIGLGGAQVLITTTITAYIAHQFGLSLEASLIIGGVVAMSSTALVIKQLTDQVELHTRHGRNAVGILLFQDIMVIPFLILASTPAVATEEASTFGVLIALAKGAAAVAIILALGHWVLRPLFRGIARFRSTELFTLTALLITLGAAWITHQLGLSLALGAFIAGMMLGETEFRHQIEAEIRPFRDVLLGLFFITVGMLLNLQMLPDVWRWVVMLLAALILLKTAIIIACCRLTGQNLAISLRTGFILAHGGEFGFAILTLALSGSLIDPQYGQVILAALLISMGMAPVLIRFNGRIAAYLQPKAVTNSRAQVKANIENTAHGVSNHVIICGYGRLGQNIARILEDENIKFVALDLDPTLVQNALKAKEPVSYGDSSSLELLKAAGLERAAALVICVDDRQSATKILAQARPARPELPILVRTRDDTRLQELLDAGASEVIPEALEASLMMASHLLLMLEIPASRVIRVVREAQIGRYQMLRQLFPGEMDSHPTGAEGSSTLHHTVEIIEGTYAANRTIAALKLEGKEISIVSLQRGKNRIPHPDENTRLEKEDLLVLYGTAEALEKVEKKMLDGDDEESLPTS
ncbi:monovalent cation:proton antiporter-2 (CPA2) family protein [Pseudomonadota bacterium]